MLYVAYGSNMNKEQMRKRCPKATFNAVGLAQDSEFIFNHVATLHEQVGSTAPVVLWNMSDEDEKIMDVYEGFPHKYHKEQITVKLDSGEYVTGIAYVMNDTQHLGIPTDAYYNRIAKGYTDAGFDVKLLEAAYDRAVEYEVDRNQTSFWDIDYDDGFTVIGEGITNFDNDLLYRGFIVGRWCANNDISLTPEEIHDVTLELSRTFDETPFYSDGDFEEFVDEYMLEYPNSQEEQKVVYYAAYGSNMVRSQMAQRCPFSEEIGVGYADGQQLEFCNYANIVPTDNLKIYTPVMLWKIDKKDWRNLDHYEGYPDLYRKETIEVESADGKKVNAVAYVMNDKYRKPAKPSKKYFFDLLEAYERLDINPWALFDAMNRVEEAEKKIRSNHKQKRIKV